MFIFYRKKIYIVYNIYEYQARVLILYYILFIFFFVPKRRGGGVAESRTQLVRVTGMRYQNLNTYRNRSHDLCKSTVCVHSCFLKQ